MLVLSRKKLESLRIGDTIEVTVLEIHKGRVRLGICAPRDVSVMRLELQQGPRSASPAAACSAATGALPAAAEESVTRREQGMQRTVPSAV
jgi:carbon storage regulator